MLFFISPVSLTLFASSGCTGRLVTNGYDIFHLSITSLQDHCRPLARGCVLAWQGGRGEGVKTGAERQELGFFKSILLFMGFIPSKKRISTSVPSASRNILMGKRRSILFPLKPAAHPWMCRTWIQTGVTSLCSGCRSRTALPKGLPSLPASAQPG